jgi:hypothetical protein
MTPAKRFGLLPPLDFVDGGALQRYVVNGLLPADFRHDGKGWVLPLRRADCQTIGAMRVCNNGSRGDYDGLDPTGGAVRLELYARASVRDIIVAGELQEALALWHLTGGAQVWVGWGEYPTAAALPHSVRRVTVAAAAPGRIDELGYCPAIAAAGEFVAAGLSVRWLPLPGASFNCETPAERRRPIGWWGK